MGDARHSEISILLPSARIAVYARDKQTLDAGRDLVEDWRFARIEVQAEEGGVETAISAYQEFSSPELVIIQTDTIDEAFTNSLEELASHCDEGTSAIIIGPENDVNLYRRLIDMGVSDYLVRPVETPVLADVIAKALIEKKGVSGSSLIAVIGAKGGVGATILSEALACGVADILGQKTVLMDASGGGSTLGVGLAFEPISTLSEAVKAVEAGKDDNLKRMLHAVSERLSVLATGGEPLLDSGVSPAQLEGLVDNLMVKSPVVIVDLSNSPKDLQRIVLSRANEIILVATPMLPALRLARSLLQEIEDIRGGEGEAVRLVINMQGFAASHEVPAKDIKEAVGYEVSATLPFLPKMFVGDESTGKKLTDDKEARALIEKELLPLVSEKIDVKATLADKSGKKSGLMGGLLGKLSKGS